MAGGAKIYRASQIKDGLLSVLSLESPSIAWGDFDEMLWQLTPTDKYQTDGSFAAAIGTGGRIAWTTGAVAGNRAGIGTSDARDMLDGATDYTLIYRLAIVDLLQIFLFAGAYETRPTAAAPPVESTDNVYFRVINGAAAANWFAVSKAGGVETAVDTGILSDTAQHDFKIVKTSGRVRYFIDGALVATITTNIPTATMGEGVVIVANDVGGKAFAIDTKVVYNKRA